MAGAAVPWPMAAVLAAGGRWIPAGVTGGDRYKHRLPCGAYHLVAG